MAQATGLRVLAAQPRWRRWTLASFLARLPMTMSLIALVLVGEEATGSLAVGAQLAGVATITSGLAAPWRGRSLDRFELRGGLQRACLATAAVLLVQAGALGVGAPVWTLFALAFLQGVAHAAISGGFRALLTPVVPPADLPRANALEAVFVEVAFIAGPALAGMLALVVGPAGVLVAMAGSVGGAAVVARRLPRLEPPLQRTGAAPWRLPGVGPIYGLALVIGACLGLFESALPARASELGFAAAAAGPFLALTAVGSGVGGLAASTLTDPVGRPLRRAVLLLGALALLLVPVGLATSILPLGAALFAAGLPIAPMNALGAMLLQSLVPAGRRAEGFAVYVAAIMVGAGVGNSLTGQLLDDVGPQVLILAAGVVPVLAGAALVCGAAVHRRAGRRHLSPGVRR